jgi:hypothetical protein
VTAIKIIHTRVGDLRRGDVIRFELPAMHGERRFSNWLEVESIQDVSYTFIVNFTRHAGHRFPNRYSLVERQVLQKVEA